jgi:hypothetical protein
VNVRGTIQTRGGGGGGSSHYHGSSAVSHEPPCIMQSRHSASSAISMRHRAGGSLRSKHSSPDRSMTYLQGECGTRVIEKQALEPQSERDLPRGRMGRRLIENSHSKRDRSMTYLQGGCSRRRADSVLGFLDSRSVGRVLVFNDPPAVRTTASMFYRSQCPWPGR